MKDWPSPVKSMYKEHYEEMFKKGICRDIVLDAIHENSDINMEIKFKVYPLATELLDIETEEIEYFPLSI